MLADELSNTRACQDWVLQLGLAGCLACLLIALLAILIIKLFLNCCFMAAELLLGEF